MTTATVPSLILTLYENEIRKIVKEVVVAVSDEFTLDPIKVALAIEQRLNFKLTVVPDARGERAKITKAVKGLNDQVKEKKKEKDENKEQCAARLRKRGVFCQCSRYAGYNDGVFCRAHEDKENRRWGRMEDTVPDVKVRNRAK